MSDEVIYICKDCNSRINYTKTSHQGQNIVTYRARCKCHDTGELRSKFLCDTYSDPWIKEPQEFTEEIIRDDKNIVLVSPETKKQMDEAAEWHKKHFGDNNANM